MLSMGEVCHRHAAFIVGNKILASPSSNPRIVAYGLRQVVYNHLLSLLVCLRSKRQEVVNELAGPIGLTVRIAGRTF